VLGVLQDDNGALSRDAARIVAKTVLRQPRVTVGLATGSTPIGMYQGVGPASSGRRIRLRHVVTGLRTDYQLIITWRMMGSDRIQLPT
jgi:6-phosphogluconolactonase/glucosamine-6-phosphate isomerase/deaminase